MKLRFREPIFDFLEDTTLAAFLGAAICAQHVRL